LKTTIKKGNGLKALFPCIAEDEILRRREERLKNMNMRNSKINSQNPLEHLEFIVLDLMSREQCWQFLYPVEPEALGIFDYFDKIKNPMDFTTVLTKIHQNKYSTIESFKDDILLIFQNATFYNPKGTEVYNAALAMEGVFTKMYKLLENIRDKKNEKLRIELEGKLKDHKVLLEKSQSERDELIKENGTLENNDKYPIIRMDTKGLIPLNEHEDKVKLYEVYNDLKDLYKIGAYKILEKEIKEKERIRRFMVETEDVVGIDMDALDGITLRRIENYVKDCFTKENIPFNQTNIIQKSEIQPPNDMKLLTPKNESPGGKSSPSLEGQQKSEDKTNSTSNGVNQPTMNEDILVENEESSSTSTSDDSTDSSDSDSSEEVDQSKLVIDSNKKLINNSTVNSFSPVGNVE